MPRWPSVHQAVTLRDKRTSDLSFVRLADYEALRDQFEGEQYEEYGDLTSSTLVVDIKYAHGTLSTMVDTLNLTPNSVELPERSPLRLRPYSLPPRAYSSSSVPSARSSVIESVTGSNTFSEPRSLPQSQPVSRPVSQVLADEDERYPHPEDDESQLHPAYRRRPFSVYSNMSASTPPPLSPSGPYSAPSIASSYSSDALSLKSGAGSPRSPSPLSTYAAIAASSPWGAAPKSQVADYSLRGTVSSTVESMYDLRTTSSQASNSYGPYSSDPADSPVVHIPLPERSQKRSASRMTKDSRRSSKMPGGGFLRRMLSRT